MTEPMAPKGKVYVCSACGKTSRGRYGTDSSYGWDESCMMNAVLANAADLVKANGRVVKINGEVSRT